MLEAAKRMEEASFGLDRALNQTTPALSGEVRLAVTEGLGTFWLAPRLVEFQRVYPGLLVDLKCEMRSADVLRLEADLAVQLEEPDKPDLKRVKIGRLHIMPFVSPSYVEIYGMPKDVDDLRQNHRIVIQDAEQTKGKEMYDKYARPRAARLCRDAQQRQQRARLGDRQGRRRRLVADLSADAWRSADPARSRRQVSNSISGSPIIRTRRKYRASGN